MRRVPAVAVHRSQPERLTITETGPSGPVLIVRPAGARSWRWKSSRELATANEAKCNCVRVTERGKEAWSETAGRWTRIGYEAMPIRASGQYTAKPLWSRVRRRKSGGGAGKDRVLTWGDLALRLKGRRGDTGREVSKGRSSGDAKGRTRRRGKSVSVEDAAHQKSAKERPERA